MITSRLILLLAVLLGGLSSIFLLPQQRHYEQPVGIELELPKMIGGIWYGRDLQVSDGEQGALGRETLFSRKSYTNARGDEIQASIVLAGRDMNTSIHRPEWCLPSQGWTIAQSDRAVIPVAEQGRLTATRLSNRRLFRDAATGATTQGRDGNPITIRNLDYYWFVGYTGVTESHFRRNCIDISERLLHGYNQRWAFVTVMATVTENLKPQGLSEEQTDRMLQEFIAKLVPTVHKETVRLQ